MHDVIKELREYGVPRERVGWLGSAIGRIKGLISTGLKEADRLKKARDAAVEQARGWKEQHSAAAAESQKWRRAHENLRVELQRERDAHAESRRAHQETLRDHSQAQVGINRLETALTHASSRAETHETASRQWMREAQKLYQKVNGLEETLGLIRPSYREYLQAERNDPQVSAALQAYRRPETKARIEEQRRQEEERQREAYEQRKPAKAQELLNWLKDRFGISALPQTNAYGDRLFLRIANGRELADVREDPERALGLLKEKELAKRRPLHFNEVFEIRTAPSPLWTAGRRGDFAKLYFYLESALGEDGARKFKKLEVTLPGWFGKIKTETYNATEKDAGRFVSFIESQLKKGVSLSRLFGGQMQE